MRDSEICFEKEHQTAPKSDNGRLLEITRRLDKLEHASRTPVGNKSRASVDKSESILEVLPPPPPRALAMSLSSSRGLLTTKTGVVRGGD